MDQPVPELVLREEFGEFGFEFGIGENAVSNASWEGGVKGVLVESILTCHVHLKKDKTCRTLW